jgi:hypothetical protein
MSQGLHKQPENSRTVYIAVCLGCYTSLSDSAPISRQVCVLCESNLFQLSLCVPHVALEYKMNKRSSAVFEKQE